MRGLSFSQAAANNAIDFNNRLKKENRRPVKAIDYGEDMYWVAGFKTWCGENKRDFDDPATYKEYFFDRLTKLTDFRDGVKEETQEPETKEETPKKAKK